MVLVQKWPFFRPFFLSNLDRENVFYLILERKNSFLRYKNKKFKNSKNWHFFQGVNPWFWSKNGHFFNFSFLSYLGHENVFYDILEREKAFLSYQKKSSKRPFFPNSLTHGFAEKMAIFPTFLLRKYGPGKTPF